MDGSTRSGNETNRFSTVLVARPPNARPSELEMQLRDECQKIRVHANLSGAHMIFPQEHGLAIRIYYFNDLNLASIIDDDDNPDDMDGILEFCHKFQWSLVLFVVPDQAVLNDMDSFVQRAMQLMDHPVPPDKVPPRFLVVSNTEQAILAIKECAETITPERCALRAKFTDKIRAANFCPKHEGEENGGNTALPSSAEEEYAYDMAAAHQVQIALDEWGSRNGLPTGETDVLLRVIPNLGQLVSVRDDALCMIPVEVSTKRKWRQFLSSPDNGPIEHGKNSIDDNFYMAPPPRNIFEAAANQGTTGTMYENEIPMEDAQFDNGYDIPQGIPTPFQTTDSQMQNTYECDAPYMSNSMEVYHLGHNLLREEVFVTPNQYAMMQYNPERPYLIPPQMTQHQHPMHTILSNQKYHASAVPWGQPVVRPSWSSPPPRPPLNYTNGSMRTIPAPGPPGGYAPTYLSQEVNMASVATSPYGTRPNVYNQENASKHMMRKFM